MEKALKVTINNVLLKKVLKKKILNAPQLTIGNI